MGIHKKLSTNLALKYLKTYLETQLKSVKLFVPNSDGDGIKLFIFVAVQCR